MTTGKWRQPDVPHKGWKTEECAMPAGSVDGIGAEAKELWRRWQEHEAGISAAANTIFAVFGVASRQGRFADRFAYNNLIEPPWVEDLAYDRGVRVRHEADVRGISQRPASVAARAIMSSGLSRNGGRKIPMTEVARRALVGYYAERLELLAATDRLFMKARSRDLRRYRNHIASTTARFAPLVTTSRSGREAASPRWGEAGKLLAV
jgi:hypothetical protein